MRLTSSLAHTAHCIARQAGGRSDRRKLQTAAVSRGGNGWRLIPSSTYLRLQLLRNGRLGGGAGVGAVVTGGRHRVGLAWGHEGVRRWMGDGLTGAEINSGCRVMLCTSWRCSTSLAACSTCGHAASREMTTCADATVSPSTSCQTCSSCTLNTAGSSRRKLRSLPSAAWCRAKRQCSRGVSARCCDGTSQCGWQTSAAGLGHSCALRDSLIHVNVGR